MKMTTIFKALLVFFFSVPAHAFVKVIENAFPVDQIQVLKETKFGIERNPKNGRYEADVAVPTYLVDAIRVAISKGALNHQQIESKIIENDKVKTIKASFIDFTTPLHKDRYARDFSKPHTLVDDEDVAFLFLNSNPNAAFVHGDTSISVIAGNLVTFTGTVEHNTIVQEGYVHILGPFTTRSFISNIGVIPVSCSNCLSICDLTYTTCTALPPLLAQGCATVRDGCYSTCWNQGDCSSPAPTDVPTQTPTTSAPTFTPTSSTPTFMPTSNTPTISQSPIIAPTAAPVEEQNMTLLDKILDWILSFLGTLLE